MTLLFLEVKFQSGLGIKVLGMKLVYKNLILFSIMSALGLLFAIIRIERLTEYMAQCNSNSEESSEYKECPKELGDWQESSESDLEG